MDRLKQNKLDEEIRKLEEAAPDPARYGREDPELESGMGRLDNNDDAVPEDRADSTGDAVDNRQPSSSQLNAEDVEDDRDTGDVRRGARDDEDGTPNMAQTPHYIDPNRRKKHT
jgi:hypothetical protein